jgi:serine protease AprX
VREGGATGIDPHHKDLAGKVLGFFDVINGLEEPYDDHGHGTHVASIAAGAGTVNPSLAGVAPGAALVGVKVLSESGSGTLSGVIAGIDWVIENQESLNIRVMNLSLGSSMPSDGTDALSRAVDSAVDAGIVVVVAAGNTGPEEYTIGSPAAAEKAITVAATHS